MSFTLPCLTVQFQAMSPSGHHEFSDAQGADQIKRSHGEIHPNTSISTMNINYFPPAREAQAITALFDKDTSFLVPAS